jgi:formylglycine-generating enzyme required for sulfatase activity
LIARHETTMGEWMEFLRTLTPAERAHRRPRTQAGDGLLLHVSDDFQVSMQIGPHLYQAPLDGFISFPARTRRARVVVARLPVSGVDWDDVRAYTAWLSSSGRVPGARPCHEREWERAARGADGRNFPGGVALLSADDANHDATYDRAPGAMGPDEVGAHPASDSPFGVADLAGNVWEWVVTGSGAPATRGGSWYHGATTALIPNRDPVDPTLRNLDTGLRVCADAPAAR